MKSIEINIAGLGRCALVPLGLLAPNERSYRNLLKTVEYSGLQEIPIDKKIKNSNIMEIILELNVDLHDGLWISGQFKGFSTYSEVEVEVDCIRAYDIVDVGGGKSINSVLTVGVDEIFAGKSNSVLCLFLCKP